MRGTHAVSALQSAVHGLDKLVHEGQYHMQACEVCRTHELSFLQSAIFCLDTVQHKGGDCNSFHLLAGTHGPLTGVTEAMSQYPDSTMHVASPLPRCMLL